MSVTDFPDPPSDDDPPAAGGEVIYSLGEVDGFTTAPSDQLVLAALQRMASAQAQLLTAEESVANSTSTATARIDEIEEAHADVMWAKARSLAAIRGKKTEEELRRATAREKAILQRLGHASFKAYIAARTAVPTQDTHLQLARREFEAARLDWDRVQADLEAASVPTMVFDHTDDELRQID